jgi:hypothetical protein
MSAARGWSLAPDGDVVLKMTKDDWEKVLLRLGCACGALPPETLHESLALLNRLCAGNPDFTPYGAPEAKQ